MSPLEAIRDWHRQLPKRIAALVADRLLWAVSRELPRIKDADEAVQKFDAWLSEESDNPFYIATKAATFRTIFELSLQDSLDERIWRERAELLCGFLEFRPDSEFARQSLRGWEFEAAQWGAQKQGWQTLVHNSLSNEALRDYIDSVLRTVTGESL